MALGRGVSGHGVEGRKQVEYNGFVELRDAVVVEIPDFRVQPEPQFADVEPPDIRHVVEVPCTPAEPDPLQWGDRDHEPKRRLLTVTSELRFGREQSNPARGQPERRSWQATLDGVQIG